LGAWATAKAFTFWISGSALAATIAAMSSQMTVNAFVMTRGGKE
jgi:hypothetical protein